MGQNIPMQLIFLSNVGGHYQLADPVRFFCGHKRVNFTDDGKLTRVTTVNFINLLSISKDIEVVFSLLTNSRVIIFKLWYKGIKAQLD